VNNYLLLGKKRASVSSLLAQVVFGFSRRQPNIGPVAQLNFVFRMGPSDRTSRSSALPTRQDISRS